MNTALPTASAASGPKGLSATAAVNNATPQGSTYLREKSAQTNWSGSIAKYARMNNVAMRINFKSYAAFHGLLRGVHVSGIRSHTGLVVSESFGCLHLSTFQRHHQPCQRSLLST